MSFSEATLAGQACTPESLCRVIAVAVGLAGLAGALSHPFGPLAVGLVYLLALVAFALSPHAWLIALPILYSIGDLYPWTGRMVVTEVDLGCATIAAALLWRDGGIAWREACKSKSFWLWGPLVVSCAVAFVNGWLHLPTAQHGDELSIYGSELNALRVVKGFFWGAFFAPFVLIELAARLSAHSQLLTGFRVAATIVALAMLWERWITVGLLDTDDPYRATGPMFSSHVGGMQIDGYWALVLPILMIPPIRAKSLLAWITIASVLMAAYLAVAATMSRGLIFVAICQTLFVFVLAARDFWVGMRFGQQSSARSLPMITGICAGLLLMIISSAAMWGRLATIRADFGVRCNHWQTLCSASDGSLFHAACGRGMGVVPGAIAAISNISACPVKLVSEPDQETSVRLTSGRAVFLEQVIDPNASGPWRLEVSALAPDDTRLSYHLCRKTLYRSFECVSGELQPSDSRSAKKASQVIDISALNPHRAKFASPPVTFAVAVAGGKTGAIDIQSVSLKDSTGHELLRNGTFEKGSDFWFFTSDDLSTWHADNLWVHLYFEQGWVGIVAFSWLTIGSLWSLARANREVSSVAKGCLAVGVVGFLAIGMIGSLIDTPNLTALFLLAIAICQSQGTPCK